MAGGQESHPACFSRQLPAVQNALAGYAQFQQLTEQYAALVIEETRRNIAGSKKTVLPPPILLAQAEEIQQLISRFQSEAPEGNAVAQLEVLVRTAVFKSANALVGWLLQQAADRVDAHYQPQARQTRQGRETIEVQGIFGGFPLARDYYSHAGKA